MDKRLSNKEVTEIINNIEKEFDVNSITYKGINFWPYIRIQLIYQLWSTPDTPKTITPAKGTALENKYLKILRDLKKYFSKKNHLRKQNLLPQNNCDFIFIAESIERKEKINDQKIHPFANTLEFFLPKGASYEIVEYNHSSEPEYYGEYKVINFLLEKVTILTEIHYLLKWKRFPKIRNFKTFISFLAKKNIQLKLSEQYVQSQLEQIYLLSKEFEKLFSRLKTKAVFYTVYFKKTNFALSLACRNLGIKSIEIQHGQQGLYNPQNNSFARIPQAGYELLPSHFWVWGKDAAAYKADLCANKFHTCVIGGNPWLNSWLHFNHFNNLLSVDVKTDKPQILVALQPITNPLTDFLMEAMIKTKTTFLWRIRLHPFMKNRKEELSELLRSANINFEMEKATDLPLYFILKNCRFVVTMWSSVAYEALYFNVKPIIIHENGKEIMKNYIEKNIFAYADNTEDLLKCLINEPNVEQKELPSFIETNLEIIKSNLKSALN